MGFFDGLGSAMTGGILSYFGQQETNRSNEAQARDASVASAQQAEASRAWQEYMSNTAYQRAVKDMSTAGLNPMLAYQQSGASTPSGATGMAFQAQMGNSLASAVEGFNRTRTSSAQSDKDVTQSDLNKVAEKKLEADTDVSKATVANVAASTAEKLQNARTSSAVEARERVQAAAIQDQRARDSALAPLYNVLESVNEWVKEKAIKANSAYDAFSKSGPVLKRNAEGIPQITIRGNK